MIFNRWQAPIIPSLDQVKMIFQAEGLVSNTEIIPAQSQVQEHRHPFDEVRMVVSGELNFIISGNPVQMKPGDKIWIPSNTKHEMRNMGSEPCVSVTASRVFHG